MGNENIRWHDPLSIFVQSRPKSGGGGGQGLLFYMGYIGMCSAQWYGLLAGLVWNRVRFLHSSLQLDMFLDGATPLSLGDTTISKCLRQPDEFEARNFVQFEHCL